MGVKSIISSRCISRDLRKYGSETVALCGGVPGKERAITKVEE